MDKYAVVLDEELEKTAAKDKNGNKRLVCPKCGKLALDTNPPICEDCGSQPFEQGSKR